jgi:hypothetical protein
LKQMSTALARMAAILSGKMTPLVEAIELHEELWFPPTWCANWQMVRSRQPAGVLTPGFNCSAGWDLRLRTQRSHTSTQNTHDEFILVRASGE